MSDSVVKLPDSVTRPGVAWATVVAFLGSFALVRAFGPTDGVVVPALVMLGAIVVATFAVDVLVYGAHRRASTGMDYRRADVDLRRVGTKVLGLYAACGVIGVLYAFLPVYGGDLYAPFLDVLRQAALPLAIAAVPYFLLVDRHQVEPRDGYWHMGQIVLLNWEEVDGAEAWALMRGWIVKGFFLPLMFGQFCNSLADLTAFDFATITDFAELYAFLFVFAFFFDLSVATIGYATTLRPLDTHIRSTEPTVLGWLVCIICYAPIWSMVTQNYLQYEGDNLEWGNWLWDHPVAYGLWGTAILACLAVYVYATAQFGCRFSNLTHRGIITSGPYRWTKHPSYVFKNLSWWLIAIPFIPGDGQWETAVRNCLLLGCVSGIYFLRARTEEQHLSRDPDYVAYARWVEEHGIFRWVRKLPRMGWLAYRAA